MNYVPCIGLEIHVELKTRTKMFCDSLNDPDEKVPNVNVCPVCLGHPGALPTINRDAVEYVLRVGIALHGMITPVARFDRKNYFYPDLPKGYQISQYASPLVTGGELLAKHIRRIHLEEDTGRLVHVDIHTSLADFNRAGIPLMELVTEPEFTHGDEVVAFARELQQILRYLNVSDADMEKGHMRVEVNISLGRWTRGKFKIGTKVEVKNLNSFKAVRDAIAYELERQKEVLTSGERVVQETRGWDEARGITESQRGKEEAHDYRYFPEPDLPPFETKIFNLTMLERNLSELPSAKRERFVRQFGLSNAHAATLIEDHDMADFYEQAESELSQYEKEKGLQGKDATKARMLLFNYLTSDLKGLLHQARVGFEGLRITPENFAELISLLMEETIKSRQAKDVLAVMFEHGGDPSTILEEKGLHMVSDADVLMLVVRKVIEENSVAVHDYKRGKAASMQFLIGQAMAKLRGKGNPGFLRELFEKELEGEIFS